MSSKTLRNGGIGCMAVPVGLFVVVLLAYLIMGILDLDPVKAIIPRMILSIVTVVAFLGFFLSIPIGITLLVLAREEAKKETAAQKVRLGANSSNLKT